MPFLLDAFEAVGRYNTISCLRLILIFSSKFWKQKISGHIFLKNKNQVFCLTRCTYVNVLWRGEGRWQKIQCLNACFPTFSSPLRPDTVTHIHCETHSHTQFLHLLIINKADSLCDLSSFISHMAGQKEQITWLHFPCEPHEAEGVQCQSCKQTSKFTASEIKKMNLQYQKDPYQKL